jgi:ABC-type antimicrobial peptide transport system permease subunit
MRDVLAQVFANLRANKLRSFLTMFGILWGVISVVVLSATGEGFQRGNQHVLEELGKNIGIVWGGAHPCRLAASARVAPSCSRSTMRGRWRASRA